MLARCLVKVRIFHSGGQANSRGHSRGQAIVEYLLMIVVALALLSVIGIAFRKIVAHLWQQMTCEVSAACYNCPPEDQIRNKIAGSCRY